MSKLNSIKYGKFSFKIFDEVYLPSDDTFLLLEHLNVNKNDMVLDLCTGCGILGIIAAEKAYKVICSDISPIAVECTKENIKNNGLDNKVEVRQGDLFDPIKNSEKFDLILFNPPYLPSEDLDEKKDWLHKAWNGGKNGRDLIDRFLNKFDIFLKTDGRVQMIQTSLSNYPETVKILQKRGFKVKIEAEKNFFYEKIVLLLIKS